MGQLGTSAYRQWVVAGRPFTLARPIEQLLAWSRAAAVPCLGTLGNDRHLLAADPEDHTPFSRTQWPDRIGYVVCAIDLENVRGLGALLLDGCLAGKYPWIKYLNFAGHHYDSRNKWKPEPSKDIHVHISIRTDYASKSIVFDPFGILPTPRRADGLGARTLDVIAPPIRGNDVVFVQKFIGPAQCGPADGVYGPHTARGVVWYQKMRGIVPASGIVNSATWAHMGIT